MSREIKGIQAAFLEEISQKLTDLINSFYENKVQFDKYKKITDSENKEIKEIMSERGFSEFSTDTLIAKKTIQKRESFNEPALIEKSGDKAETVFFLGATGVGKTTTIGKLAYQFTQAGNKVVLGELGGFYVELKSEGAVTCDDFTAQNIKEVNARWSPGESLQNLRDAATFRLVEGRKAQAAGIKVVKNQDTIQGME